MHWCSSCGFSGPAMNSHARKLSQQYAAALRGYLALRQETLLQQGYELGRSAVAHGLGVLDMACVHQRALASCLVPPLSSEEKARVLAAAESFFLEALSPFEATHRGFREANQRLHQLNAALEHRNAELAALNRDLRNLSNQILHVQEEERKRISRELHDEVGQALTAINMNLAVLGHNGSGETKPLTKKITDIQALVAQTMDSVHRFARELRPTMLDELGLVPALRSYLHGFAKRTGVRVRFHGSAEAESLNGEQKTVLYRVAQESLTNVARHAQASEVDVTLRKLNYGVQMEIKDNGKAFQVDRQLAAKGRKRLGLLGMQERVRLVRGRFAVESTRGQGTTVRVEVPFKADALRNGSVNRDHSARG
jgi:signal transduction histidine kinase